ncbi:hypothetical protein [Phreatobacter stygius]|uniref:Uncharacterized protein n=1 Tax=Phreatobacter stygius TaxID=1940610 RepID=A0A4D7B9W8_9HYPH|nr:hypothetical protein [Phreatobacter stygius]QCI66958.1 hypothetical protein E8M01_23565 [Phreatobacter stygius]
MDGTDRRRGAMFKASRPALIFGSLLVVAAELFATGASAQSARRGGERADLLGGLLAAGTSGEICYARSYAADHLAAHPHQRVTAMTLLLKRGREPATPAEFQIFVTVRGDRNLWSANGECAAGSGITCSVECDGGGFSIASNATPQTVLLSLEDPDGRISMNGCDGGERELQAGRDDRRFRLDRAPNSVCAAAARRMERGR